MKDFLIVAMPSPSGFGKLRLGEGGYDKRVRMFNQDTLVKMVDDRSNAADSALKILWPEPRNKFTVPFYSASASNTLRFHAASRRDVFEDKESGLLFVLGAGPFDDVIELYDKTKQQRRSFKRPEFGRQHGQTLQYEFPFASSFLNRRREGALAHFFGDSDKPGTDIDSGDNPSGALAAILNPLVLRLSLSGDELDFSRRESNPIGLGDVLNWLLEASAQRGGYLHVEPIAEPADDARCRALDVIAQRALRSGANGKPRAASVTEDLLLARGPLEATHPRWLPFFCLDYLGGRFELANAWGSRRWHPPQGDAQLRPNAAWFASYWARLWGSDPISAGDAPPPILPGAVGDPTRGRTAFAPFGQPISKARFDRIYDSCSETLAALGETPMAGADAAPTLLDRELRDVLQDVYRDLAGTEHDKVHQVAVTAWTAGSHSDGSAKVSAKGLAGTTDSGDATTQPLVDTKMLLERIGRAAFLPVSSVLVELPALPPPTTADRAALRRSLSVSDGDADGVAGSGRDAEPRMRWFDHAGSMRWAGEAFLTSLVGTKGGAETDDDPGDNPGMIRLGPGWWRDWRDRLFAPGDARPFQLIPDSVFILGHSKLSAEPEGDALGESGPLRWTGGRMAFD